MPLDEEILQDIRQAESIAEMAQAVKRIPKAVTALMHEKAHACKIAGVVSEITDSVTKKLLQRAENLMVIKGRGLPPVEYCWLALGSGGRREQTLSSDQDSAIIHGDVSPESEAGVRDYFLELAQYVTDGLAQCGFEKCPGHIMATNPEWCRSLTSWKSMVHRWTFSPNPEAIRQFTIFLDFRPIYGLEDLAHTLRVYTLALIQNAPILLHNFTKDALSHRVPLTMFKNVLLEREKAHKNEVDLKRAACVHIVDCIRIFAMRESIAEVNTLERLGQLTQRDVFSVEEFEDDAGAFQSLMMFRIRENLRKIELGLPLDNYISPENLSKSDRLVLRQSFLAVDRLQMKTGIAFQVEGLL